MKQAYFRRQVSFLLAAFLAAERAKWSAVIRRAGIKPPELNGLLATCGRALRGLDLVDLHGPASLLAGRDDRECSDTEDQSQRALEGNGGRPYCRSLAVVKERRSSATKHLRGRISVDHQTQNDTPNVDALHKGQ